LVITAIHKERDFWSSGGNISEVRKLVYDATSIADLIQKLGAVVY